MIIYIPNVNIIFYYLFIYLVNILITINLLLLMNLINLFLIIALNYIVYMCLFIWVLVLILVLIFILIGFMVMDIRFAILFNGCLNQYGFVLFFIDDHVYGFIKRMLSVYLLGGIDQYYFKYFLFTSYII